MNLNTLYESILIIIIMIKEYEEQTTWINIQNFFNFKFSIYNSICVLLL